VIDSFSAPTSEIFQAGSDIASLGSEVLTINTTLDGADLPLHAFGLVFAAGDTWSAYRDRLLGGMGQVQAISHELANLGSTTCTASHSYLDGDAAAAMNLAITTRDCRVQAGDTRYRTP
jgi:hypothetical protein